MTNERFSHAEKKIKMKKWKKMRIMNRNEKMETNVKQNCKQNENVNHEMKTKMKKHNKKEGKEMDTERHEEKWEWKVEKSEKKLLNTWEKEITGERHNGEKTVQTLVWWLDPDFLWRLDFWNPKTKQIKKRKKKNKGWKRNENNERKWKC